MVFERISTSDTDCLNRADAPPRHYTVLKLRFQQIQPINRLQSKIYDLQASFPGVINGIGRASRVFRQVADTRIAAIYEVPVSLKHTGNEEYSNPRGQITYKENMILSRHGYSTSLYTSERRRILVHLLESGKNSKAEIKDILTRFISQRSERCPGAAVIWTNDLEFVNDYGLENEDVVKFQ